MRNDDDGDDDDARIQRFIDNRIDMRLGRTDGRYADARRRRPDQGDLWY